MVARRLSEEQIRESLSLYLLHGATKAADLLKISRHSVSHRVRTAKERGIEVVAQRSFEIAPQPDDDLSIEEVIETKKKILDRKLAKDKWARLIQVQVKIPGPIVIGVFGDPHVDDDGCDIHRLEADLDLISSDPWVMGINLGDITNNWVGRLEKKYAQQIATRAHAEKLLEWVLGPQRNYIAVVKGNHDVWNNGGSLIDWALRGSAAVNQAHGARLGISFPAGQSIRLHARHDFPGRSMYNAAHGLRRELAFGYRDHLLVAGDIHQDTYMVIPNPAEDFVSHLARVSGYKILDDYADENRFLEYRIAPSVWFVIQPEHKNKGELIKAFWDGQEAVKWCRFLRREAGL